MIKKFFNIVFSALFLLQTFTLPISVPKLVLCVSQDHVQLEIKGTSAECTHSAIPDVAFSRLQHNYHGDNCADVPLFRHVQHVLSGNHPVRFFQTYSIVLASKTNIQPLIILPHSNNFPQAFTFRRALQSVVLLI